MALRLKIGDRYQETSSKDKAAIIKINFEFNQYTAVYDDDGREWTSDDSCIEELCEACDETFINCPAMASHSRHYDWEVR